MKILLSGGGTGGHITPLLAVAHELKKARPRAKIIYVGERSGKFAHLADENESIDEVRTVYAGKFRRYQGQSWLAGLLDIKTNLLNLRDFFLFLIGTAQSLLLVKRLKPDVAFLKGGFVGVPVGFAAAICRVPFVTHDSDATAGLANRMVGQWAAYHATALPESFYAYPKDRTRYVGVLVGEDYKAITSRLQAKYKAQLGVPPESRLLLVTGGSLGAKRLNESFKGIVDKLLQDYSDLVVVHQTGKGKADLYEDYSHPRLVVFPFLKDMHRYTGAADLVIARAGANTLAELGVQGKAVVVVPNPELAGGHQTKNAKKLADAKAVVVVPEKSKRRPARPVGQTGGNAGHLDKAVRGLLKSAKKRERLGQKLQSMSPAGAANKLAVLLLEVADKQV